jgi:Flp pilus assembly protein CpaB
VQNVLKGRKLSASRGGTLTLGIIAAVVAAILLVVYIHNVRSSAKSDVAPAPVVVANALIPKGTSGTVIASKHLYTTKAYPKDQIKVGAVTDPGYLLGRIATGDIVPNQQITEADLSAETTNAIPTQITGNERAIALPVSGPQGLVGTVQAGNHVDVYLQLGAVLTLLQPNLLVLQAPSGNSQSSLTTISNNGGSGMILRVNSRQAARLAFADSQGALWYVLRPTVGATKTPPQKITVQDLLSGTVAG